MQVHAAEQLAKTFLIVQQHGGGGARPCRCCWVAAQAAHASAAQAGAHACMAHAVEATHPVVHHPTSRAWVNSRPVAGTAQSLVSI